MSVQTNERRKSSYVMRMAVAAPLIVLVLATMTRPVPWLLALAVVALTATYFEVANMARRPVPHLARFLLRLPEQVSGSDLAWLEGVIVLLGVLCFVALGLVNNRLTVTLLACITLTDAFAWLIGSIYGYLARVCGWEIWRFAPDISPKKTWPGTLGGILGGVLVAQPLAGFVGFGVIATPNLYGMLVVVSVAGVCGDLLESYVKRRAGVKDAGGLLPGHGGVVDRLDSVAFAFLVLAML